jgi:hypothetical protein
MDNYALKNIALQAGLSKNEINNYYDKAVNEAKYLGKHHDDDYVLSIVRTLVGLDEEDINQTVKNINTKFIESGYSDFNKFLEDVWEETSATSGIVSTDFPPEDRPEHKLGHAVKFPPDVEDKKEE